MDLAPTRRGATRDVTAGTVGSVVDELDRFRSIEEQLWARAGVAVTERRLRLRTGDVVRVQESGDGPALLLVHGASVAGTSWIQLMAALPDFRCIALDRPGCGLSDPLAAGRLHDVAEIETYADDLLADVLDALELPSAFVGATSYGGYFALRGMANHPGRVDRFVEYGWPIGAPPDRAALPLRLAALPGLRSLMAHVPMTKRLLRSTLSQMGLKRALRSGAFDDDMLEWTLALMRDTDTLKNEMQSSPAIVTPIAGINKRILLSDGLLARVAAPSLFLWGDEDTNGGEAVARAFVPRLRRGELEIVRQAGHAPWIDQLGLCAERTRAFLGGPRTYPPS